MTTFPVRHGGHSLPEQADAAAEMIAATIGVSIEPAPFQPVLRCRATDGLVPALSPPRRGRAAHVQHSGALVAGDEDCWSVPQPISPKHLGLAPPLEVSDVDREIENLPHAGWSPI